MIPEHLLVDENEDLTGVSATAVFSPCRTFRYRLTRLWDPTLPSINFLMLNPSVADAFILDATVRRCIAFAKRENAGSLVVSNIFAVRSTDPKVLPDLDDPIGPDNDLAIRDAALEAKFTIAAWGHWGSVRDRGAEVRRLLADLRRPDGSKVDLHVLGLTAGGEPRHPLYMPKASPLTPWE